MNERDKLYQRAFQDLDDFLKETDGTPDEVKTVKELRRMITQLADDPTTLDQLRRYGKKLNQYRRQYPEQYPPREDLS